MIQTKICNHDGRSVVGKFLGEVGLGGEGVLSRTPSPPKVSLPPSIFHFELTEGGFADEVIFEFTQANHVRLVKVNLLVVFGFPCLDQQDFVFVGIGKIVVLAMASVLGENIRQDAFLLHFLHESLAFAVIAFELHVYGVHFLFSFGMVLVLWYYSTKSAVCQILRCISIKDQTLYLSSTSDSIASFRRLEGLTKAKCKRTHKSRNGRTSAKQKKHIGTSKAITAAYILIVTDTVEKPSSSVIFPLAIGTNGFLV